MLVTVGLLVYRLPSTVIKFCSGGPVATIFLCGFIAVITAFRVFVNGNPVVKLDAATVHHVRNTHLFSEILLMHYLLIICKKALFSFALAYVVSGLQFNTVFWLYFCLFGTYLTIADSLAWILYHNGRIILWVALVYLTSTVLLFLPSVFSAAALGLLIIGCLAYVCCFLKLDYAKYEEQLCYIDETMAATSRKDYAEMVRIVEENRPQTVSGVKLFMFPLRRNTVFIYKSLIEILRSHRQIWIFLALLFALGVVIVNTRILSFLSLGEDHLMSTIVATYCIVTVAITAYEIPAKQYRTLLDKRALGLFIPLSKERILLQHLIPHLILNGPFAVLISVCFSKMSIYTVALWMILCIACTGIVWSKTLTSRKSNAVRLVLTILLITTIFTYVELL